MILRVCIQACKYCCPAVRHQYTSRSGEEYRHSTEYHRQYSSCWGSITYKYIYLLPVLLLCSVYLIEMVDRSVMHFPTTTTAVTNVCRMLYTSICFRSTYISLLRKGPYGTWSKSTLRRRLQTTGSSSAASGHVLAYPWHRTIGNYY